MRRAYIAGPMAGYDDFNYPSFYGAEAALDLAGWRVVNPARLDAVTGNADVFTGVDTATATVSTKARAAFLKRDFEWLAKCDAIFLLPGWQSSVGANAEFLMARIMDLDVYVLEWDMAGRWWSWEEAPILTPLWSPIYGHIEELRT